MGGRVNRDGESLHHGDGPEKPVGSYEYTGAWETWGPSKPPERRADCETEH